MNTDNFVLDTTIRSLDTNQSGNATTFDSSYSDQNLISTHLLLNVIISLVGLAGLRHTLPVIRMKTTPKKPLEVESISAVHRLLGLPKPLHPLIGVIRCEQFRPEAIEALNPMINNFYVISIIQEFTGKWKYGQHHYDFEEGVMSFFAPGQVIANDITQTYPGLSIIFHPDLIRNFPLATTIKKYGYFAYSVHEALHLSEQEETMVIGLMQAIESEYGRGIDYYTQTVLVAQLDLLLTYCDRFYNRQFITRRRVHSDVLLKLEALLGELINSESVAQTSLPTVQVVAERLHISPTYLSDMLRSLTGLNTQQHIHAKLIEKAKTLLATTNLTVGEIADQLGFDYPQSFHKLFKKKMNVSPLVFRQSFN